MKKITICLYLFICFGFIVQAQWTPITSGTMAKLEAIHFIDSQTGYCSGAFTSTLETTNGGDSWILSGSQGFKDFGFYDDTYGYGASVVSQSMAKTTNGGSSWTPLTPTNLNSLWGCCATSETTAYWVGTGGVIMTTINGGLSISELNSGTVNLLTDVVFTNSTTGYIVAQTTGVKKTINSGLTWNTVYTPPGGTLLTEMYFVDENIGYLVGSGGLVAKTTDAGQNWNNLTTNSDGYLQGVHFNDANNGIVVGIQGEILYTKNGGINWNSQSSGTSENLYDVTMLSASSAIVSGDNGIILKNSNIVAGIADHFSSLILNIYPNPVSDQFTIEKPIDFKKNIEVNILDASLKQIAKKSIPVNQQKTEIDISNHSKGIYYIQLIADDEITIKKVLKN